MMRRFLALLATASLLLCAGCGRIGPDYVRPTVDLPENWKTINGADPSLWRPAQPADAGPKRDWWTLFGDDMLNELEGGCLAGNPNLAAALARLDQALAQSAGRGAALYPTVQLGASASRSRSSADRPLSAPGVPNSSIIQNDFRPVFSASYEFDWLGRIRRDIEGARASAAQADADMENVRLILTAQLASVYFQLRQQDEEIGAVSESAALQEKVLRLIMRRYQLGAAGQADVVQQTALLESTRAQLRLLSAQRNQQENALATLTGTPAARFRLPPGKLPAVAPAIPVAVPSHLLERRPDVASAERAMAAANAQIGVAKAAFFPILSLTPSYAGYESRIIPDLLSVPALTWSLGLAATQTLFDGGRIAAGVDFAKAGYALTVANYRQSVLSAIEETQNGMGNLQELNAALRSQEAAVRNQNRAYEISLRRYQEGLDNAITLATIQQNQLAAKRVQSQIYGGRFVSLVGLIKALGGGWEGPAASVQPHPCGAPGVGEADDECRKTILPQVKR